MSSGVLSGLSAYILFIFISYLVYTTRCSKSCSPYQDVEFTAWGIRAVHCVTQGLVCVIALQHCIKYTCSNTDVKPDHLTYI